MHFVATADTDIGIAKRTNQDSVLFKHASCETGEVFLGIVCDGVGGLNKGEVASASVIKAFSKWFDEELPLELKHLDMQMIGEKWVWLLKELNMKISEYAKKSNASMGTTFTGVLFVNEEYVAVHVGDTRLYHIDSKIKQLTKDQTVVAREIERGTLTPEEAKTDKRRHVLLQCVGASKHLTPDVIYGKTEKGAYLLCSDGFRQEITEEEILKSLNLSNLVNKNAMHIYCKYLMELAKSREEKDNISVLLIKVE